MADEPDRSIIFGEGGDEGVQRRIIEEIDHDTLPSRDDEGLELVCVFERVFERRGLLHLGECLRETPGSVQVVSAIFPVLLFQALGVQARGRPTDGRDRDAVSRFPQRDIGLVELTEEVASLAGAVIGQSL